jgi:hypothetical protein
MSPVFEATISEGVPGPRPKIARGLYDFAVDGGAISAIPLMGAAHIPAGATIYGGWIEVHTQLTSGGAATIAVGVETTTDIVPAIAVASWTAGRKRIVPGLTVGATLAASDVVRTTAARDITMTIAAVALTAGKFSVLLFYVDPLVTL